MTAERQKLHSGVVRNGYPWLKPNDLLEIA
jgi:hypothetical protein